MNIQEANKLIAEFMGGYCTEDDVTLIMKTIQTL